MASNSRKRRADLTCADDATSKDPWLSYHSARSSPIPSHRHTVHSGASRSPIQIPSEPRRQKPDVSQSSRLKNTPKPYVSPYETRPTFGTSQNQSQFSLQAPQQVVYKPNILHQPHPHSKLSKNFHWIPYPLGLMHYDSWHKLHHHANVHPPLPFRCPVCRAEREPTPHMRKVFLVAERLAWEEGYHTIQEKDQNEELNWAVNYELGILDPFVEDAEQRPGGKNSQKNKFYPYRNEFEMKQALKLIFTSEDITEVKWSLWIGMQMELQSMFEKPGSSSPQSILAKPSPSACKALQPSPGHNPRPKTPEIECIDLTGSPDRAPKTQSRAPAFGIRTPPSSSLEYLDKTNGTSLRKDAASSSQLGSSLARGKMPAEKPTEAHGYIIEDRAITSYKTLQDFYSLLDRIERTSYVGALFLEAYAERLRDDMCKKCWLNRYVDFDAAKA